MHKKGLFEKILLYTGSLIAVALLVYTLYNSGNSKIVFVDISKIVEHYKLKKDLEAENDQQLNKIKNVKDSLVVARKLSAAQGAEAARIDTIIARVDYAFNQYYHQSSQEINKKIWERLNPVIEQYGKERGFALVIGANGAGTVLYGAPRQDVTEDLIQFVNNKYAKGD